MYCSSSPAILHLYFKTYKYFIYLYIYITYITYIFTKMSNVYWSIYNHLTTSVLLEMFILNITGKKKNSAKSAFLMWILREKDVFQTFALDCKHFRICIVRASLTLFIFMHAALKILFSRLNAFTWMLLYLKNYGVCVCVLQKAADTQASPDGRRLGVSLHWTPALAAHWDLTSTLNISQVSEHRYTLYTHTLSRMHFLTKKLVILFSNNALNWSKLAV